LHPLTARFSRDEEEISLERGQAVSILDVIMIRRTKLVLLRCRAV
jgi:hypothetical protein